MTSTAFILAPSSSDLPISPALSLLPFSLGSSAAPYTSTSAPIAQYFRPRPSIAVGASDPDPSPTGVAKGTEEEKGKGKGKGRGNVVAAFRGRQVVGQYIDVPKGWRGMVLSADKRPDRGGVEMHHASEDREAKPSTSTASNDMGGDDGTSLRRTTRQAASGGRVRGAGQVALSRPRARQAKASTVQNKKRFRLDSDDEDDEDDEDAAAGTQARLARTPSKRARNTYTTPRKVAADSESGRGGTPIPEIVVQEATPLKHPLPTPKKRLSERRASPPPRPVGLSGPPADVDVGRELGATESMDVVESVVGEDDGPAREPECTAEAEAEAEATGDVKSELIGEQPSTEEQVIPSPATEDDPPNFGITVDKAAPSTTLGTAESTLPVGTQREHAMTPESEPEPKSEQRNSIDVDVDVDGPVRILRPTARFDGFMLYTADAPLAGFRADELSPEADADADADNTKEETETDDVKDGTAPNQNQDNADMQLRKGWWRVGGAGEGGDEVVRAMGEWLGFCEVLNKPVYLDGLETDDE